MNSKLFCFAISGALSIFDPLFLPNTAYTNEVTSSMLQLDPSVKTGRLSNGLTYYICKNAKPENRIELRLAVKAGSVLETEEQQGLAHFLEHMNFKGSKHFTAAELISYLESIGSQFGPDLNAYTSFDHTVYSLHLPLDQKDVLEKGFTILSDWATHALIEDTGVESERGIIHDEWRRGRNAKQRIRDKWIQYVFAESQYANRLPIGKEDVILNAHPDLIRDFYKKWYRPEYMAIIVVGDFDSESKIEEMVHSYFDNLFPISTSTSNEKPIFPVANRNEKIYLVNTDPELTQTSCTITSHRPYTAINKLEHVKDWLADQLFYTALRNRFNEQKEKKGSHIVQFYAASMQFVEPVTIDFMSIAFPDSHTLQGYEELMAELHRIKRYGFTAKELEIAKSTLQSEYERAAYNKHSIESRQKIEELLEHFFNGDAYVDKEYLFEIVKNTLSEISLKDIHSQVSYFIESTNLVVSCEIPQSETNATLVETDTLKSIEKAVESRELEPYTDLALRTKLIERDLQPGDIVQQSYHSEIDTHEITLSNGMRLLLKPTHFKKDSVLVFANALGGTASLKEEDIFAADLAADLVEEAGLDGLTPSQIDRVLDGRQIYITPQWGLYNRSIEGECRKQDVEQMLSLIHLYMTSPNNRKEGFEVALGKIEQKLLNREKNPQVIFQDTVIATNTGNSPYFAPLTYEKVKNIDPNRSYELYCQGFSNPEDFTVTFVGDFNVEEFIPLALKYLGSISPNKERSPIIAKKAPLLFPHASVEKTVEAGLDKQSITQITFNVATPLSEKDELDLRIACQILNKALIRALRFELSGTYSPSVSLRTFKPVLDQGFLVISFSCAEQDIQKMVDTVHKVIADIQKNGPKDEDMQAALQIHLRRFEKDCKNNPLWLYSLSQRDQLKWPLEDILDLPNKINSLTKEQIQKAFTAYFHLGHTTKVSLVPAKSDVSLSQKQASHL